MRSVVHVRAAAIAAVLSVLAACFAGDGPLDPGADSSVDSQVLSNQTQSDIVDTSSTDAVAFARRSYAVSNDAPTAWISKPAHNSSWTRGTAIAFAGTGRDAEDGALSGSSLRWSSDLDGEFGTGKSFSYSNLSAGTHRITLTGIDSDGATFSHNRIITVNGTAAAVGNDAPVATMSAPSDGASYAQGVRVTFTASVRDEESGTLSGSAIQWYSSRDGAIGSGTSFSRTDLSVGDHTIGLIARDPQGAADTVTRSLRITTVTTSTSNDEPFGLISSPSNGSSFAAGASVVFSGSASDPEDGTLSGASLVWTSSRDGQIGTGNTFTKSNLSVGTHTITFTSKDSRGATFEHNRSITITAASSNKLPTANITAPSNGASVTQGSYVSFSGSGYDAESGSLSGSSLVWTSSRDGQIGTGTSFSRNSLSAGTHTITLTARDPQGATGSASRTLTVNSVAATNAAPKASFTVSCVLLVCSFDASASDDDNGIVQYAWNFGGGSVLRTSPLTSHTFLVAGTVNVSLTVKDAAGLSNTTSKSVTTLSGSTGGTSSGSGAEPTGMTMISDRPFNCINASSCGEGSWYFGGNSANARVVSDASAPRSGSTVVQQLYTPELSAGSGPASFGLAFSGRRVLYQASWVKLSSNFVGHSTGVNKITHFWINGINRLFTKAQGTGSGTLVPAIGLQQLARSYSVGSKSGTSVTLLPNVGSKNIQRGQWHKYEVLLTANTPGSANGSAEMWLDGTKVISYTGIMFTEAGGTSTWTDIKWNPTWGGLGGSVNETFYMAMDHMYLSGK